MFLPQLNEELYKIDLEILKLNSNRYILLEEEVKKVAKFSIGFEFTHPAYGNCCIKGIDTELNRKEPLDLENNVYVIGQQIYNPYYKYLIGSDTFKNDDCYMSLTEQDIENCL